MGCRASWDINNSLQTPESCLPPVTRNCLKRCCQNPCSFLFSRWAPNSFSHSSQQIQNHLDSLLFVFHCLLNENTKWSRPVCRAFSQEAGGRWVTLNQVTVIYCKGSAGFMKHVCCFVCHGSEMKVCFGVASSLFGGQTQRGWLQFVCCSVVEMDGWHVWLH